MSQGFFYFSGHGSPVLGSDRATIKDGLLVPYEATLDTLEAYQYACDKLEALGLEQNPQMSVRTAIPISRVK